ncbi:PilZ domain-containing protein [Thermodesulfobacteriota bacterium]
MTEENRRQAVRHNIKVDVAVVTREAQSASAIATEISPDGIRIETAKVMQPGTQVAIFLQLQDEIQLRGTILWTVGYLEKGLTMYQIGIKTEAIVRPDVTAIEHTDKADLVQEILLAIKMKDEPE